MVFQYGSYFPRQLPAGRFSKSHFETAKRPDFFTDLKMCGSKSHSEIGRFYRITNQLLNLGSDEDFTTDFLLETMVLEKKTTFFCCIFNYRLYSIDCVQLKLVVMQVGTGTAFQLRNGKKITLRIIGPSYRGVWMCIAGFWDLQTTIFEIPWFLGNYRSQ